MWAWAWKRCVPEFAVGDDATPAPRHIHYFPTPARHRPGYRSGCWVAPNFTWPPGSAGFPRYRRRHLPVPR